MSRFLNVLIASTLIAGPAAAEKFGLGREALPEEIAAWDIDVRPDGHGLPVGSGTVEEGEVLYTEQCAMCHGDFGEAVGRWPVLAGGDGSLASEDPVKTVGSYWPYLSTVYDYVHRAMPFGNAQSLSDDEVYAITAYILNLNFLVDYDFELSNENFAEVAMPNEDNFFMDDRLEAEFGEFIREPCMENCKDAVEIVKRAAVIDVTPEDAAARERIEAAAGTEEVAAAETAPAEETPAEAAAAGPDPELVAEGENVFRKCKACHQIGEGAKHRTGPHLNGVFGRTAGSAEGFRYSNPMQAAGEDGLVWTAETMSEYLADPRGYIKGNRMSFAGLKSDDELAAINAYLEAASVE
jgi:cytochrome c